MPNFSKSTEMMTTIEIVPIINRPPIVGVPCFFACNSEKSVDFSPESAFSRICFPTLNLINCLVNQGVRMIEIAKARVADPLIKERLWIVSFNFSSCIGWG